MNNARVAQLYRILSAAFAELADELAPAPTPANDAPTPRRRARPTRHPPVDDTKISPVGAERAHRALRKHRLSGDGDGS